MTRSPANARPDATARGPLPAVFAGLFGALLGLCLLKFGNPVVMDKYIDRPSNIYEWIFWAWPFGIATWVLLVVVCVGLAVLRRNKSGVPPFLLLLPALWLVWQFLSATQTVDTTLTRFTLMHFTGCVVCFYLGCFALGPGKSLWLFWLCLLAAFLLVLTAGFEQHFGGLEASRKMFFLYGNSDPNNPLSPELIKRLSTNRIFGTLLYPNTLAQVILLVLPPLLAFLWSLQGRFTAGARAFLVGVVAMGALACLFWSGSKGGWLLMLAVGFVGTLFVPMRRQLKIALICSALVLGLAGFIVKHAGYFRKGATSVEARFDYWRAALEITSEKPLLGTGPGTFQVPYQRIKKPESEMARLTHNDYLEQACDSGVPGFLLFTGFVGWCMAYLYLRGGLRSDPVRLAVWLGLLGWALQSLLEFGLYIPAVGWTAFAFMGWLLGSAANQFDRNQVTR